MRPWKAASLALLLVAGLALFGQGARVSLTIDQAIARALANQPLLQQAQAAVEAARARVGQANSAYYPFINGNASYNRLSPEAFSIASALPPGLPLSSLLGSNPSPVVLGLLNYPLSFVPLDMWDFNIGLNQVIFEFGKRGIQVKLTESGVSAAQIGVEQIRSSLAYQAAQSFYSVLFLKGQLAALDTQLVNLREYLDATRVKAQTGAATRYDELSTEVRISALESQRIEADNQLTGQSIGLKQLLGMDETAALDLQGEFTAGTPATQDQQALLDTAMARRADVRQAAEAERAAELGRRLATTNG